MTRLLFVAHLDLAPVAFRLTYVCSQIVTGLVGRHSHSVGHTEICRRKKARLCSSSTPIQPRFLNKRLCRRRPVGPRLLNVQWAERPILEVQKMDHDMSKKEQYGIQTKLINDIVATIVNISFGPKGKVTLLNGQLPQPMAL